MPYYSNENTGKIEVGLAEEIYEDQENTDSLRTLPSAKNAPHILSISFLRNSTGDDSIVIDCDDIELQCVDQVLHLAVDAQNLRIYAMEQSRGTWSATPPGSMNVKYLKAENME